LGRQLADPAGFAGFLAGFDWEGWTAKETATLLFVVQEGRILLIEKLRGLGKGKINGPGGRLEPGETPEQAAVREMEEETHATPLGVQPAGELWFQFTDGYSIRVYVFRADGIEGDLTATAEAIPLWFDLDRIPYARMWEDDAMWLPLLLDRQPFFGKFVFAGERMLTHDLELRQR